jgi:predicted transcriptional regulator
MKDSHLTLRLPHELARALARWAKARGVPKSLVAREAVTRYLARKPEAGEDRVSVTARQLAARWRTLPHVTPAEAGALETDIAEGRRALPTIASTWE